MAFRTHVLMALCMASAGAGTASSVVFAQAAGMPDNVRPAGGGDMAARVRTALHADPALLDKHIEVTMQNGKVLLRGFVTTAEDLQKAKRAADQAAGKDNVVNQVILKEGGDGGSG